jgi:hypothetical protein
MSGSFDENSLHNAMGSIDDDVGIEDGATARLGIGAGATATLQGNLKGE